MWYVIQVVTGEEEKIIDMCEKLIGVSDSDDSVLRKCFIPYTIRQRKYQGAWHDEKKKLFPGYIFLISDNSEKLYMQLKNIPRLTKLLRIGDDIVPLSVQEETFLKKLGGEKHIVENSIAYIEGDKIVVTEGPLKGFEGYIKKIDRHKRIAWLEINLMGRIMEAQVGLEVVEKR